MSVSDYVGQLEREYHTARAELTAKTAQFKSWN
jgi:hypothetical protein